MPVVAIVGSPNMGKSSLFNRVLKRKIAIVDDRPGVTRDRNYMESSWNGVNFMLIDTGGMMPASKEEMDLEISTQVSIALSEADVVVYLVDANNEPTDLDLEISRTFRRLCADKVIVAANKAETPAAHLQLNTYWSLGLGEPLPVSAMHGNGVGDLLDAIVSRINKIPKKDRMQEYSYAVQFCVIGRPNAGKSSLVNAILGEDRTIVSAQAGTTRDSIDSIFEFEGQRVKIIDTAGLRKKSHVKDDVEYYANLRTIRTIYRSDVCVLMIDTARDIAEQDMRVIERVRHDRRGLVIVWNKWDTIEKDSKTFDKLVKATREKYTDLQNIPMLSISALTGQRVPEVLRTVLKVRENLAFRPGRKELEDNFFEWTRRHPHPFRPVEPVRFLGIKQQQNDNYPHFVVFCTNTHRVEASYTSYLKNKIIKEYGYQGAFVVIEYKEPGRKSNKAEKSVFKEGSFGVLEVEI